MCVIIVEHLNKGGNVTNIIFNDNRRYFFTPCNLTINPFEIYGMPNNIDKLALQPAEYIRLIEKYYPELWDAVPFNELIEGGSIPFGMSSILSRQDNRYSINGAFVPAPSDGGLTWYDGGECIVYNKDDLIEFYRVIKTHGRDYAYRKRVEGVFNF